MSNLDKLIRREQYHRQLAHSHERKSEEHMNTANEILLQIQAQAENERELASCELTNSLGV